MGQNPASSDERGSTIEVASDPGSVAIKRSSFWIPNRVDTRRLPFEVSLMVRSELSPLGILTLVGFSVGAVLFDMDGVLVDSTAAVERHWREFASRHRLDAETLISGIHGRRSSEIIAECVPHADIGRELGWMESLELADASDVSVLPGAQWLTEHLHPSSWAVVTSGARSIAEARLASAGLATPGVLITSDDVIRGKPDPSGYLQAAEMLGISPQSCIVFEDAPAGIAAALAAAMVAIGVSTTHTTAELSAAHQVIENLSCVSVRERLPLVFELVDPGARNR